MNSKSSCREELQKEVKFQETFLSGLMHSLPFSHLHVDRVTKAINKLRNAQLHLQKVEQAWASIKKQTVLLERSIMELQGDRPQAIASKCSTLVAPLLEELANAATDVLRAEEAAGVECRLRCRSSCNLLEHEAALSSFTKNCIIELDELVSFEEVLDHFVSEFVFSVNDILANSC